jgi:predicted Fe-Mo cluster-binding NifX family protein
MIVCFPTLEDKGLDSRLSDHFGSAPWFVAVDTDTNETTAITNRNKDHQHGQCNPIVALRGLKLDAVAVQGIGPGAINKLKAMNLRVLRVQAATVRQAIEQVNQGALPEMTIEDACKSHGNSC